MLIRKQCPRCVCTVWYPASNTAPSDSWVLGFALLCSLLPEWTEAIHIHDAQSKVETMVDDVWGQTRKGSVVPPFSPGSLISGKGNLHVMRSLEQDCGQALAQRNQGFPPTASTNMPALWGSHTGSGSSSSRQAFRGLQPPETPMPQPPASTAPQFMTPRNCASQ